MVRRRKMNRAAVASQKIEHELGGSEAVWAVVILAAHVGEMWGKFVCGLGPHRAWKFTTGC